MPIGSSAEVDLTNTYTVYNDGSNIKAKSGATGGIPYSSTDLSVVLDSIIDNISPAGTPTMIELAADNLGMSTQFNNLDSDRVGNITIKGQGMGVTNIVPSSAIVGGTVFDIAGAVTGSSISITAGATAGSLSITLSDATTFATNDYILIRSTDAFSTQSSAQGKKGEIRRVVTKAGNVLTVDKWLHDTYTTTPTCVKINMLQNITLQDLTIAAGVGYVGTGTFLAMRYTDNPRIERVEVKDHLGSGIDMQSCTNFYVGAVCTQTPGATFNGQYGVKPTCASENGEFYVIGKGRYRHLFTCDASGTANFEGQVRGMKISGSGETCDEATFDTHATGEGFLFDRCVVMGTRNNVAGGDAKGFQMRAKKCQVTNCIVFRAIGKGITLMEDAATSIVANNEVVETRQTETSQLGYGIEIRGNTNSCLIANNIIRDSARDGILIRTTSSGHVITGNIIVNNGGDGINATDVTLVTCTGNKITGNSHGITTTGTSDYWIITSNTKRTNTTADSLVGANNQVANNTT